MKDYSSVKAPTPMMVEILMDVHEKEILHFEQDDVSMIRSAGGLIARGLLRVKEYVNKKGKKLNVPYVTMSGITFLSETQPKKINSTAMPGSGEGFQKPRK